MDQKSISLLANLTTVKDIEEQCLGDLDKNIESQRKCWKTLEDLRSAEKQLLVQLQLSAQSTALYNQIKDTSHLWTGHQLLADHHRIYHGVHAKQSGSKS